jgi:hypothetical protein
MGNLSSGTDDSSSIDDSYADVCRWQLMLAEEFNVNQGIGGGIAEETFLTDVKSSVPTQFYQYLLVMITNFYQYCR